MLYVSACLCAFLFYMPHQFCIPMYFGNVWTVWAPKKVLITLFQYLFHVKTEWNISTNDRRNRHKYPSPNTLIIKYFWALSYNHCGEYGVSLIYPILNFKKSVCPKSIWMQHCSSALIFLSALHAFTFLRVFTFLNVSNFWHALSAFTIFMKCRTTDNQPQQARIRQTK